MGRRLNYDAIAQKIREQLSIVGCTKGDIAKDLGISYRSLMRVCKACRIGTPQQGHHRITEALKRNELIKHVLELYCEHRLTKRQISRNLKVNYNFVNEVCKEYEDDHLQKAAENSDSENFIKALRQFHPERENPR